MSEDPSRPADRRPPEGARVAGRPPLTAADVAARVTAYCQRHGVAPTPEGLPPFPSGQRETPQHREWLVVYRAVKRLAARQASSPGAARRRRAVQGTLECAVCGEPVSASADARELRLGPGRAKARLHGACADLVDRMRAAGPEAVARVLALLSPR